MTENYSPPKSREHEPTRQLSKSTLLQMNDIVNLPEAGLLPDKGFFDEEASRKLAKWTIKNRNRLPVILSESRSQYKPEELSPAAMLELKVLLKTPRSVYDAYKIANDEDYSFQVVRRLARFNEDMREAVRANRDMSRSSLVAGMNGAVLWTGLPEQYHDFASKTFIGITNGVRGEFAFDQIAGSPAAQEAGIECTHTSIEEDLKEGADNKLSVPIWNGDSKKIVSYLVNVKSNLKDVHARQKEHEKGKPYAIDGDGLVYIWCGVSPYDFGDRMTLLQSAAEEKGRETVPILREIAELVDKQNALKEVGRAALESA